MNIQSIKDQRVIALIEKGKSQGHLSFEELLETMSATDYDEEELTAFYDMIEEMGIEIEEEKHLESNVIDFEIGCLIHKLKQLEKEDR